MGFEGLNTKRALYISVAVSLVAHVVLFVLLTYLPREEELPPAPYVVSIVEPPAEEPPPEPFIEEPPPAEMPVDEIPPIVRVPPPEEQPPEHMDGLGESREVPREETEDIREQPSRRAKSGDEPPSLHGPNEGIGPEQLFDEDVIQEFAKVEPRKEGRADDNITFDPQGFRYKGYKRMLWDKLQWALDNNPLPFRVPKGTVVAIRLTIRKDGSLEKLEIVSPSGHKTYDEYAAKVLLDAAPFWPLPESWQKEKFYYSTYVEFVGARSIFTIR